MNKLGWELLHGETRVVSVEMPSFTNEESFLKMSADMKNKSKGEGYIKNNSQSPINAFEYLFTLSTGACECNFNIFAKMYLNIVNLNPSTYTFIFRFHPKVHGFLSCYLFQQQQ